MIIRNGVQMGDAMGWGIGSVLKSAGSKLGGVAVKAGELYADVQTGGQYSAVKGKLFGGKGGSGGSAGDQPPPAPAKKVPGWVLPVALGGGGLLLVLALGRRK